MRFILYQFTYFVIFVFLLNNHATIVAMDAFYPSPYQVDPNHDTRNPRFRHMVHPPPSSESHFSEQERSELQEHLIHDFSDPSHPTSELALHDYNRDGRLDGHELRFLFLSGTSLKEINAMVEELLEMDDANNDGFISRDEF